MAMAAKNIVLLRAVCGSYDTSKKPARKPPSGQAAAAAAAAAAPVVGDADGDTPIHVAYYHRVGGGGGVGGGDGDGSSSSSTFELRPTVTAKIATAGLRTVADLRAHLATCPGVLDGADLTAGCV